MSYQLIFLDTETTGNETRDRLCQLAYKTPGQTVDDMFNKLYKAPLPISIDAMAVHHITEAMIADQPLFADSLEYPAVKELLEAPTSVVVAHNAPFDLQMLEKDGIFVTRWIDTLRVVRHLDPEMKIPKHSMQYLRYLLNLDADITTPVQAHDARGDVIVLELLYKRLATKIREESGSDEDQAIEQMITISQSPVRVGKFTFGKHRGKTVSEVAKEDRGYLEWLLTQKKQSDQNEDDWIFTLEEALGLR